MELWREELYHHGIKGQKWGIRRYQNPDGTLTVEGKRRYYEPDGRLSAAGEKVIKKFNKRVNKDWLNAYNSTAKEFNKWISQYNDDFNKKYGKNTQLGSNFETTIGQEYIKKVSAQWDKLYTRALLDRFGTEPITNSKTWVENMPTMHQYYGYIVDKG